MKVLFRYDCGPKLSDRLATLAAQGDWEIVACSENDDADYWRHMKDADALWHVLRPVTAAHIAAAPRLKLIQKIGVGVNTIDLDAAQARGIAVCNMPGTNSRAVAEATVLLMLAALRRANALDAATRAGEGWRLGPALQESYGEIAGRTVGLVGFGAVPAILAPILAAMGARVLYTARAPKPGVPAEWRDLPALLADSDIVSLHIPQTPQTARLFGAEAFASMKPGAIFVNTARGGLADEAALAAALKNGRVAAAGLDVFAEEPVPPDHPLLKLDNVALLPHVAWLTPETFARSLGVAAENCRRLRAGEALRHRVV